MNLLPKNSPRVPLATTLSPGSLLMYENDGTPILAVVLQFRKQRYVVFNDRGRELELDAARIHELPGKAPAAITTIEERTQYLTALRAQSQPASEAIDLAELWGFVKDEVRDFETADLCQLYLGGNSLEQHLAMRFALLKEQLYFKRRKDFFIPRTDAQVQELRHVEAIKQERRKKDEATLNFFKERVQNPRCPLPDEARDTINMLEDTVVDTDDVDQARQKERKELLDRSAAILGLSPHGRNEERAFQILLKIGHFGADENLPLIHYRPPLEFSKEALHEAHQRTLPATVAEYLTPDQPKRRDLTALTCVTIDDISTKDMDDALSFEKTAHGYMLGIHISDVTSVVAINSVVDEQAKLRATSLYLPHRTVHMLPDTYSEDKASLRANTLRPAMSCLIQLNDQLEIESTEIVPSLIRVKERLTYHQIDAFFDSESAHAAILPFDVMYQFAVSHETLRIENGASRVQKREIMPVLDSEGKLTFEEIDEESPGRALVAEMMVLANKSFAEFAADNNVPLIFRGQEPGGELDDSSLEKIPLGPARDYAQRSKLKRSVSGVTPQYHSTLGLAAYAQVTSPIRRYADLCNQRQLLAQLTGQTPPYTADNLLAIMAETEEALSRALSISKETRRFWFLRFLERRAQQGPISGIVIRTDLKNPLVELDEIYMPAFVKCDKMPALGDRINAKITAVQPHWDYLKLEQVK